jgi:hypothetical protein
MQGVPPTARVRRVDTHRLIPSKFSRDESVLTRIAGDGIVLADLFDLENLTNDRLLAEADLSPGIGIHELVFGVPYYRIVNASFTHPQPMGSRFNGPQRGAWYAAFELRTAQIEVAFHKTVHLAEIGRFEDEVSFDDYQADFSGDFHDLRGGPDGLIAPALTACLSPDSYVASQRLAETLLESGSLGVVYPSVRRTAGTCLACFRPALVANVRKGHTYTYLWNGNPKPSIRKHA